MKLQRIWEKIGVLALLSFAALAQAADAPDYPKRPIRLIVPFAAGGGVDINARILGAKLGETLGTSVIVDNKPGAGTNIGNDFVAKAEPDGYTLLVTTAALAINMSLYKNLPFDAVRDFSPISFVSISPNILVANPALPVRSVADLIELAKKKRGALNYGSAGSGSTQHLVGELFKTSTGTDMLHVPFKGSAPLLTSLIAGDIDLTFANIAPISAYVKSGKLRALATTGTNRSPLMPDLPTMKEAGVDGVEVDVWVGVFAPRNTPKNVIDKLAASIARITQAADFKRMLAEQGNEAVSNTPVEFAKTMQSEVAKWRKIVQASGATAE